MEFLEHGGTGELDCCRDLRDGGDVESESHGAANVVHRVGLEFVDEDVVVSCIADGAADDADCKSESCDCGDEILVPLSVYRVI